MNKELARRVIVQVLAFPEDHAQGIWVADETGAPFRYNGTEICPSKACLAGWAIFLDGGADAIKKHINETIDVTYFRDYDDRWCAAAAKCLGIDVGKSHSNWSNEYEKLRELFLNMNEDKAINAFIKLFGLNYEECALEAKKIREETA
jgi:hypothetical protein